jgi:spermidine/putrescine transport system ATP-binding protein
MRGAEVALEGVGLAYGSFWAVRGIDLDIRPGEFFSLLGPSGCGKTTILRLVSGFVEPSEGVIRIAGRDVRGVGPAARPTSLVFQNLALFPLMKVWENVAFGLEVRGVPKAERRRRAEELLELVALPGFADKRVDELSGGQRQRVAIARSLAVEPQVLLLDEPLSALDLKLRQHMRAELKAIQRRTGVTFVYITHDQGEALTMSDRVAVMSQGRIEQVGTPAEIYDAPATAFVASFVGESNPLPGRVRESGGGFATLETALGPLRARDPRGLATGSPAIVIVRPERCRLDGAGEADAADNLVEGRIERVDFEGAFANLLVASPAGPGLVVQLANDGRLAGLAAGAPVTVRFPPEAALALPEGPLARE